MNHTSRLDYIIFWSSILTFVVFNHKAKGIFTESNNLDCSDIQCPTKCPADSYLKSTFDEDEEEFEDYDDEFFSHDTFVEEIGHFEKLPPAVELHDTHLPQHILKERQKREVFFQQDIERCCDDQKCVCKKCENVPKCLEGYIAVEVHAGRAIPGDCCSMYKCVMKKKCQVGIKQSWWTSKCRNCSCFGENELCEQLCPEEKIVHSCYSDYWRKPMMNGAFWKEGSCTSCSCERGDKRCLTPVCPKLNCKNTVKFEDECCPKCIGDEETKETMEIVHNKEEEIDDFGEGHDAEFTTFDIPIIKTNEEHVSVSTEVSSFSIINESTLDESQTTSPLEKIEKPSTVPISGAIFEEVSSTFEPEIYGISEANTLSPGTTTLTEKPESEADLILYSSNKTTTEQPPKSQEHESSITAEKTTSIGIIELTSTTGEVQTHLRTGNISSATKTFKELSLEETQTVPTSTHNTTVEDLSTTPTSFIKELSTFTAAMDSSTVYTINPTTDFETSNTSESSTISSNLYTTDSAIETTRTSSTSLSTDASPETTATSEIPFLTSASTEFSTTLESITLNSNLVTTISQTSTKTTNTPFESSAETSTIRLVSPTTSPQETTTYTTSTETASTKESTYASTTTSPEPLKPLFQPYGDFSTEKNANRQNQVRVIFDDIDYMVMIALFTGSLFCIGLGLTIRYTKNRKKMYSSIPNSESSLSKTSTNTLIMVDVD